MVKEDNKGIHIRTIQASKAFEASERGEYIKADYTGMMPYSLLTIKLDSMRGFKKHKVILEGTKKNPINYKYLSDDLINVKFDNKLLSLEDTKEVFKRDIENLKKSITKLKIKEKLVDEEVKLLKKLHSILERKEGRLVEINKVPADNNYWKEMSTGELRTYLYKEGFNLEGVDFVQFARSSSKSRKGEVLFIKETLHKEIQEWMRLGFEFEEDSPVDLVSLRAYESLISSGIQSTVNIDVNSILLVEDLQSTFEIKTPIKVIRKGADGKLKVDIEEPKEKDTFKITNDIFDGESLMDYKTFFEGKDYSFMLLRNHMFKSAGFSFDIQQFMRDNCPEGVEFEKWKIKDMYGKSILAKNVRIITTPNSCKFIKFAYLMTDNKSYKGFEKLPLKEQKKAEKAIYNTWKKKAGTIFGVCKYEKESIHTFDNDFEDSVHRLSYQICNTLITDEIGMKELAQEEVHYINKLNTDNEAFIAYLERTSNDNNSNRLYVELYRHNEEFQYTSMFKDFKYTTLNSYKKKVKRGSIHISGAEYAVMCSNPLELAKWAIGQFDNKNLEAIALKGDQVYTKLFPFGDEISAFRNPHSSASSIYTCTNTYSDSIHEYMENISKNIIIVNAIGTTLQEQCGGADFDSDSLLISNNKSLLKLTIDSDGMYPTVVSGITQKQANSYTYSPEAMAIADERISKSGRLIGEVANLGQLAFSIHQHLKIEGKEKKANKVLSQVDKICSLQTCVIDMAKKEFDVKIQSEISSIRNELNKYIQDFKKFKLNKNVIYVKYIGKTSTKSKLRQVISITKPKFFEYVEAKKITKERKSKRNRKVKVVYDYFNTPMDYLQKIIDDTKSTTSTRTIELKKIMNPEIKRSEANRNQLPELKALAKEVDSYFIELNLKNIENDELMSNATKATAKFKKKLSKLKINAETIYVLIDDMYNNKKTEKSSKMINLLLYSHREEFCKVFCKK